MLNFNCMIPVDASVVSKINIRVSPADTPSDKAYKELLNDQLDWCNSNRDAIITKANKLYRLITETPEKSQNLTRRCCDFKKLEKVLAKYLDSSSD